MEQKEVSRGDLVYRKLKTDEKFAIFSPICYWNKEILRKFAVSYPRCVVART